MSRSPENQRPSSADSFDSDFQKALELSKKEHYRPPSANSVDEDLRRALELSLRQEQIASSSTDLEFERALALSAQEQPGPSSPRARISEWQQAVPLQADQDQPPRRQKTDTPAFRPPPPIPSRPSYSSPRNGRPSPRDLHYPERGYLTIPKRRIFMVLHNPSRHLLARLPAYTLQNYRKEIVLVSLVHVLLARPPTRPAPARSHLLISAQNQRQARQLRHLSLASPEDGCAMKGVSPPKQQCPLLKHYRHLIFLRTLPHPLVVRPRHSPYHRRRIPAFSKAR
jgi:hypothetical protein